MATTNAYPGVCTKCGSQVEAQAGVLGDKVGGRWTVVHRGACPTPTVRRAPAGTAGHRCEVCGRANAHYTSDLSGIGGYACKRCDDGSLSFA